MKVLDRVRVVWCQLSESMAWLVERLAGVDVRSGEALIMWTALGNGMQSLGEQEGRSLSPFLFSSIQYLHFNPRLWSLALIGVGVMQVGAFVPALWGDRFRLGRALIMLLAGVLLLIVTGAVLTSGYPPIVTWRYALPCGANFSLAYILWLRHDVKHAYERRLMAAAGDRRTGGHSSAEHPLPVRAEERVLLDGESKGGSGACTR